MTKTIKSIIAGISAVAIIASAAVGGWAINEYVIKNNSIVIENSLGDNGGAVIGESQGSGIKLMSTKIAAADYEEYGVSAQAETAYTVTVTPYPSDAMDTYTWECDNTEQIQLSPSGDTKSCTVSCTGAFGTQATVTVTSKVTPDVTATLVLEYVKRVESVDVEIAGGKIVIDGENSFTATPQYGVGTITPDFSVSGGTLDFDFSGVTQSVSNKQLNTYYIRSVDEVKVFTFTGNMFETESPFDMFVQSTKTYTTDLARAAIQTYPTEAQLENAFNNSFAEKATGTTSDGTLVINYTYGFNADDSVSEGGFSETGSVSVDVAFDVSALVVNAEGITLDKDRVYF